MARTARAAPPGPVEKKPARAVAVPTTSTTAFTSPPPKPSYKSDGVSDNDIFMLPLSDYYIMFTLGALALAVRVFRISQPSSVVFDEVQYVVQRTKYIIQNNTADNTQLRRIRQQVHQGQVLYGRAPAPG
jgi:dolichyl-phosphate-mannose-protein mannosyltransferase